MGTVCIEEDIKRYVIAYDGSFQGVQKRAKEDLRARYRTATEEEIDEMFRKAFYDAVDKGDIQIVPYEQMTEQQKHLFDNNDVIYRLKSNFKI